jgi:hypothetical protein
MLTDPAWDVLHIGQVMLALPHAIWNTGLRAAVVMIPLYSIISMWTIHLLTSLYVEYKTRKVAHLPIGRLYELGRAVFAQWHA